jgi:hypothetical protein
MYLCSIDPEAVQQESLMRDTLCMPLMQHFQLPTRTAMVTFVLLVLSGRSAVDIEQNVVQELLDVLLPNNTSVWRHWKHFIAPKISQVKNVREWEAAEEMENLTLTERERELLNYLLADAKRAYAAYEMYKAQFESMK